MSYGLPLKKIEELLGRSDNVTEYERKFKIVTIKSELLFIAKHIRFYKILKSDGSSTITIVYRSGINSDHWLMWRPSKEQAKAMRDYFWQCYSEIDEQNKRVKDGKYYG